MSDKNPFPDENNTGHVWDDNLRELDNPAPHWWTIAFWISIAWFVVYTILYPSWPIGEKAIAGVMGWTQMQEYQEGVAEVDKVRAPFEAKLAGMSGKEILADEGLSAYTMASVKVLFGENCAACHGSGGQGGPSFPVIADDDWLYGGSIEKIEETITMGRKGTMIAHAKMLSDGEVTKLAQAIVDGKPAAEPLFAEKACFACHGADGKGMQVMGSANLTDAIWRFDEEDRLASAKYTIIHGVNDASDPLTREAEMPAFNERLSKDEIKKLAVYVYKLGGGQ